MQLKSGNSSSHVQKAPTAKAQWHPFASPLPRPVEILQVEDNLADVRLLQEAFSTDSEQVHLTVMSDGETALAFLRRASTETAGLLPDLILLDLNLPKIDGYTVLVTLKADPLLRHIPVVVLSSSESEYDIRRAYTLGASCYIVKPAEFQLFCQTIQTLAEFWLNCVRLPSE